MSFLLFLHLPGGEECLRMLGHFLLALAVFHDSLAHKNLLVSLDSVTKSTMEEFLLCTMIDFIIHSYPLG